MLRPWSEQIAHRSMESILPVGGYRSMKLILPSGIQLVMVRVESSHLESLGVERKNFRAMMTVLIINTLDRKEHPRFANVSTDDQK